MKAVMNGEEMVKKLGRLACVFLLFIFCGSLSFGQDKVPQDSTKVRQNVDQTAGNINSQNGNAYGKTNLGANASGQNVKTIKAGKPDMSRARGARPPVIVRPSGSGIPKGIGKPGGIGHRVGG